MRNFALGLVALLGCADPPPSIECSGFTAAQWTHPVGLDQLPILNPIVDVRVTSGENPSATVGLELRWNNSDGFHLTSNPLVDGDGHRYCPELAPTFAASLGDLTPTDVVDGGWQCVVISGAFCTDPRMTFAVPPNTHTVDPTLVFGDTSKSISVELGDVFIPRLATPSGGSWTFTRGTSATIAWTPASDLDDLTDIAVSVDNPHTLFEQFGTSITHDATSLTFAVPFDAMTGTGTMTLVLSGTRNGVSVSESFVAPAVVQ